ncbi:MAG TPA: hypothetical protein VFG79_14205, partial [Solirubrobacter sp.]|nr:hypothetical protein [Solirubrobacter sp.]
MDVRFRRALGASITIAALAAGAAPAQARPAVSVSTVSSLHGKAGTLRGAVINETARATRARVMISLHRRGTQRRVLGRTAV